MISSTPTAPAASVSLARVPFRGGFILAAAGPVDQEGARPVPLAPFCEALGIDIDSQRQKLRGKGWACPVIITAQIPGDDQTRRVFCIPLRALPMWLATIHPAKVAPEARPMLEAYQAEACDVLYRHFLAPGAGRLDPDVARLIEGKIAYLESRVNEQRDELRRLRDRDRRRTREPAPLGMGHRLNPEDAARVRAWCEGRPIVATAEAMEALGLATWGKAEASALAAELRGLGYDRRKTYIAKGCQKWRWRRPGPSLLALVAHRDEAAALPARCALWPAAPPPPSPPAAPAPRPRRGGEPGPAAPRQSPCAPSTRRPRRRPRGRSPATTSPPCSPAWWPSARPTRAPAAPRPGLCSPP